METVEIVIKLPKEDYKNIKDDVKKFLSMPAHKVPVLYEAVDKGILLPKGYGRLIILSEDAIKREQTFLGFSCQSWISDVSLSDATVAIIEVDAESKEKEE